jgi:uncharacterized membrane protein
MANKTIKNAISTLLALSLAGASYAADTMGNIEGMDKCYGIAKKGMNDCTSASHSCAGESKIDGDKDAWLSVPTGMCRKIVGGSTKASS